MLQLLILRIEASHTKAISILFKFSLAHSASLSLAGEAQVWLRLASNKLVKFLILLSWFLHWPSTGKAEAIGVAVRRKRNETRVDHILIVDS
jgi:hypothetical protein